MAKCERAGGRSAWVICRVKQTAGQSQAHFGGANGAEHQDTATIGDERCGVYMEGEGERVLFRARLDGPHPLALPIPWGRGTEQSTLVIALPHPWPPWPSDGEGKRKVHRPTASPVDPFHQMERRKLRMAQYAPFSMSAFRERENCIAVTPSAFLR